MATVADSDHTPASLDAFWMPFTANRYFKSDPRLFAAAEGMYFTTTDGSQVLDGTAGLWCVNAGHGRREISEAVAAQMDRLDFGPTFQMGHPGAFELAERLTAHLPTGIDHVFFTNSGSESADTALKIARAYQQARGAPGRWRLIGREKGYHGTNFGGVSVGGIPNNRRAFGPLLPGVDHMRHTLDLENNAFTRGLPAYGDHLADDLERLAQLHGPETIAAVMVEPIAGSAGVILPSQGYLKRLREICDRHDILLIFDEVITGFGRVGDAFASERMAVKPDIVTMAKGLTNGAIPMGAVAVNREIYEACTGTGSPRGHAIELFHGYTYSGHPVACAAGLAALDLYEAEDLFQRGRELEDYWADSLHQLAAAPNVIDVRNYGLIGAVQLAPRRGDPGARAFEVFRHCLDAGLLIRVTADIIALSPPLILTTAEIDRITAILGDGLEAVAHHES